MYPDAVIVIELYTIASGIRYVVHTSLHVTLLKCELIRKIWSTPQTPDYPLLI